MFNFLASVYTTWELRHVFPRELEKLGTSLLAPPMACSWVAGSHGPKASCDWFQVWKGRIAGLWRSCLKTFQQQFPKPLYPFSRVPLSFDRIINLLFLKKWYPGFFWEKVQRVFSLHVLSRISGPGVARLYWPRYTCCVCLFCTFLLYFWPIFLKLFLFFKYFLK